MVFTKVIDGKEVQMKATLRTAYELQRIHNKPYQQIFADMGTMMLEEQIGLLYAAYKLGCGAEQPELTKSQFLDYYLDNDGESLDTLTSDLEKLIEGTSGKKLSEFVDPLEVNPGETS